MKALPVHLLIALSLAGLAPLRAEGPPLSPPTSAVCASPEHRQLDFWVGDWDAYDVGGDDKVAARLHVDLLLDGCVLREDYEGTNGLHGQSFSIYDAARRVWHQTWVTNRGQLLVIEGGLEGDRIVLRGTIPPDPASHHPEQRLRASWKRQGDGVRETAETSGDEGKSWQTLFDILFRPHRL